MFLGEINIDAQRQNPWADTAISRGSTGREVTQKKIQSLKPTLTNNSTLQGTAREIYHYG